MTLRAREGAATVLTAAMIFCAAVVLVTVQLSARAAKAAVWLVDGVGMAAAWYVDAAVPFAMQAAMSCAANAVQFTTGMANWSIIEIDRLARLVLLLALSVSQLVTAFGVALSGPATITLLLIVAMVVIKLLAPRVGEFLNDVLSVPLAVGGIAYAIMQAKRR